MTRKTNTTSNETPSIVLKTIYDDIMNDNANSTLTTKKMRAKLRVEMRDIHVHNSSWLFTQSQYERARAMFDDNYRAKIERAQKRNAKTNATPRKRNAKTPVVVDATNDDANASHDVNA